MNTKIYKNAFTLVELAIVIVIIGLLVGGVLAGQELIEQAKIRAQIKQLSDYDAAVISFKGKYGYLPGDMPFAEATKFKFSSSNVAGQQNPNGDGLINDFNGMMPPRLAWSESTYFFRQLLQSKLIKGGINPQPGSFSVGSEFPEDSFGKGGIAAISLADGGLYYFMGPTMRNNLTNVSNFHIISEAPSITPAQAYGLDEKLDDGNPSTGMIRPVIVSNSATNFNNDTNANTCIGANTSVYNTTNDNALKCRLLVRSKGV
jgi:prepilin-type N-terminal cleavage/methylation domain-containing protein